jgi:hypothetical protein
MGCVKRVRRGRFNPTTLRRPRVFPAPSRAAPTTNSCLVNAQRQQRDSAPLGLQLLALNWPSPVRKVRISRAAGERYPAPARLAPLVKQVTSARPVTTPHRASAPLAPTAHFTPGQATPLHASRAPHLAKIPAPRRLSQPQAPQWLTSTPVLRRLPSPPARRRLRRPLTLSLRRSTLSQAARARKTPLVANAASSRASLASTE